MLHEIVHQNADDVHANEHQNVRDHLQIKQTQFAQKQRRSSDEEKTQASMSIFEIRR